MAVKSRKSECAISRSLGCSTPALLRPTTRTDATSEPSRHSMSAPWPTIPEAPKMTTFMGSAPAGGGYGGVGIQSHVQSAWQASQLNSAPPVAR